MLNIDTIIEDFSNRRCMIVCSDRTVSSPSDFNEVKDSKSKFFTFLETNISKVTEVGITGDSVQCIEELDVLCMFITLFSMKVHLYLTNTLHMEMIDKLLKNGYIHSYTIIG